MKEHLKEIRAEKMFEMQENEKNRITMDELADIFKSPLQTDYKIIQKETIKRSDETR